MVVHYFGIKMLILILKIQFLEKIVPVQIMEMVGVVLSDWEQMAILMVTLKIRCLNVIMQVMQVVLLLQILL